VRIRRGGRGGSLVAMRDPSRPPKDPRQQAAAVWAAFGVLAALTVAVAGLYLLGLFLAPIANLSLFGSNK
jgi:hypothetical protein